MKFLRGMVGHPVSIVILPIVAVVVIAWACLALGEQNPADPRTNQTERALQEQGDSNRVTQGSVKPSTEQEQAHSEQCAACRYVLKLSDPMILLTFMLLLAALTQARIYHLQAGLMRESLAETRKANQSTLDALVMGNRAYLHVVSIKVEWGESNPRMFLVVQNSGKLAATIRGWAAACRQAALPPVPEHECLTHYGNAGPVAPNGGEVTLAANIPLGWANGNWKALLSGALMLNPWGVVTYETGFHDVGGELGFGFEFDPSSPRPSHGERFAATDVPGYNYTR